MTRSDHFTAGNGFRLALVLVASLTLANAAAAQYTAQILLPPSDAPSNTSTRAFAINNRGQVFGEALVNRGPVLWTNGVPARLPVPAGYAIANAGSGNLLNDEGVAITTVGRVQGGVLVQGFGDILVWQNGIPSLLPPVPEVLIAGCSEDYGKRPLGINGAGHIFGMSVGLTIPGNPASNTCRRYWIYKNGSFEMLPTQAPPGTQGCALAYVVTESSANLLNSADHVAVQRAGINSPTCPFISGVLAGTSFTPIGQVLAVQINNHDQAIAWSGEANGQTRSYFWNGSGLVDFGVTVGWFSMNNLGQVIFRDVSLGCALRLYSNGTTSNVSLPAGFSYLNSSCDATHLNDGGQIAVSPQGGQIVVLTPSGGGTGDVTAPLLANVSGDMTVTATSGAGATVQWTSPTADDDRDGPVPAVCTPASGSLFPIGSTTVTCTATDSSGNIGAGSFTVTVQSAFPPVAQDGSFTTLEDTPISGTLPASNPGGGPLLFSVVTPPLRGTVIITDPSTGAFTYTPELNRFGGASFTFQVSSGTQASNVATVSITIDPVNDVPLAFDSSVDAIEDTPFTAVFDAGDSDSLVVQFEVVSQPAHGTVTIPNPVAPPLGGSFSYVPHANFNGTDSFTYRVVDSGVNSNVGTVTISVAAVNDAPVANAVAIAMQEGAAVQSGMLSAGDVDDVALTFAIVSPPAKGTATITDAATGAFTYTPSAGAIGYDAFTFRATDAGGASSTATAMAFIVAASPRWPGQTIRAHASQGEQIFVGTTGVYSADRRFWATTQRFGPGESTPFRDVFLQDIGANRLTWVTRNGDGDSFGPVLSGDGRFLSFTSEASNLVLNDTNGVRDVFVYDTQTRQTTLVSVASDGTQGNRGGSGGVSVDGRYVAFTSISTNLVPGDTNGFADVFVHDRQTGQTTLVSLASDGSQGNGDSIGGGLSADGRYVAFRSSASNLVAGDSNGVADVFVYDRQAGVTTRVSVASDGAQGTGESIGAGLTADGRYVLFQSYASDLVPGDTNGFADAFVHDRLTGVTTRVSVATDGTEANSPALPTRISEDGRFVAFDSFATNLAPPDPDFPTDTFVVGGVTVSPSAVNVPSAGGTGSIDVTFDYPGTPWTATTTSPWITITAPAGGSTNGTVNFTVAPNSGPARTGSIMAALHTVTITQEGPTVPVAQDGSLTTAEDTGASATLSASDPNGDPLAFAVVAPPVHGTVTITNAASGAFTYTPAANYNGPDSFTFHATAGGDTSNVATVSVTVTPVNDAPVALDGTLAVDYNTAATGTLAATDVDGPALSFEVVTNGSHGTATITNAATGAFTYVPNAGASGSDSIQFRVSDGSLTSAGTVSITIAPSPTPTVVVRTPNGGERVFVNSPTTIQWTATGAIASFDVELSRNSGSTFAPIPGCMSLPGTATSCAWTPTTPTSATAMIRVTGRTASGITAVDRSDGPFSIVTGVPLVAVSAPNTAVTWSVGTARVITWTHNLGSPSFVRVDLSRDGGATWETLAASIQNATVAAGSFTWIATGPATTNALVRVSTLDGLATDVSNVPFTIQAPTLTVTSPNTNVTWRAGTSGMLTFSHNLGTGQVVHLDVSRDDGAMWTRVASVTTTATSTVSYAWPVTVPSTTLGRMRATWATNPSVSDVSDAAFTITPRIRVLSPNTATTWSAGTTRTITWNHNLPAGQTVDIAFSPDNGASWLPVASGVPNQSATSGSFTGRFPATLTTQGLVRVSSSSNALDADVNDVPLIVVAPTVTVTAPGMNTTWTIGSSRTISWTHNLGTAESVAIEISRDGGVSWTPITPSTPNALNTSGSFAWTVTGPATAAARIRVSWTIDGTVQGVSGTFRVQ